MNIQKACNTGDIARVNELLKDSRVDPSSQNNKAIKWAYIFSSIDKNYLKIVIIFFL
jgi:hypothetical protein